MRLATGLLETEEVYLIRLRVASDHRSRLDSERFPSPQTRGPLWDGATVRRGGEACFPDGKLKPLEIQTTTLDELLEEAGIKEIDFLSMDIEGGEAKALRGFDIARFRPALVCIEVAAENREFVAKYFAQHGYERLTKYEPYDSVNQYYARRGGT